MLPSSEVQKVSTDPSEKEPDERKKKDIKEDISLYREQTERLQATYPSSGVYRRGEKTPIWEYHGPYIYDAYVSNDGENLVAIEGESWFTASFVSGTLLPEEAAQKQFDSPAVTFYKYGEKVRSYTVREIVTDVAKLRHSPKDVQWRAGEGMVIQTDILNLFTQDGTRCRFNVKTGELIEKKINDYTNQKIAFGVIFVVIAIVILAAIRWLVRGNPNPQLPVAV
jgi:hypothetical protein